MAPSSSERVPVVVLSGCLGSGKTTLLNHLLGRTRGRIGVIVNDFGDINVDAFLVEGQVDATATFSGGCLCCLSDPSELDVALDSLSAPRLGLDAIVIEASGLAEPRELARMLLASGVRRIRFGGVVELLDASAWAADEMPVAVDHLQVASLLVVNKTDRLERRPEAMARLEAAVARHAPATPVLRTTFGALDPELLFDITERQERTGQLSFADLRQDDPGRSDGHADHHGHDHAAFTSVSLESPLPASPRALVSFLERRPAGIVRVKGRTWLDIPGHRGQYVVQAVGGWLAFDKRPWPAGTRPVTQLVAIGVHLDAVSIEAALRACLSEEGPLSADEANAVLRYTR